MAVIEFCRSAGGRAYVLEDLASLQGRNPDAAEKIFEGIDRLKEQTLDDLNRSLYVKKIKGETYLYELRISWNGVEYRILFGAYGPIYILIHFFIKKDERTRRKEIETALKRLSRMPYEL